MRRVRVEYDELLGVAQWSPRYSRRPVRRVQVLMRWLALVAIALLSTYAFARCDFPPNFDVSGPECSIVDQTTECLCSECMAWDPSVAALWYEVLRTNPDGSTQIVGSTLPRNRPEYTDEDGLHHLAIVSTLWCVAWDSDFPAAGELYAYNVRACNGSGCGPWSAAAIQHRATAYTDGRVWINGGLTP